VFSSHVRGLALSLFPSPFPRASVRCLRLAPQVDEGGIVGTKLYAKNCDVDDINVKCLRAIDKPPVWYSAADSGNEPFLSQLQKGACLCQCACTCLFSAPYLPPSLPPSLSLSLPLLILVLP